jgi:hypothetical protein
MYYKGTGKQRGFPELRLANTLSWLSQGGCCKICQPLNTVVMLKYFNRTVLIAGDLFSLKEM